MDKEKESFGEILADVPTEFINRFCVCYLKQCISGIGYVSGMITGFRSIKGQDLIYFQAEDEHDFFVPLNNIAYYQIISPEALEKSKKQNKEKVEKARHKEEENIRNEIETRMHQVEEQRQNADKSQSSGNPSTEKEGDSDFVFQL